METQSAFVLGTTVNDVFNMVVHYELTHPYSEEELK